MADPINPYEAPQAHGDAAPIDEHGYRTSPVASTHMPPGVPYIVGNEAAERFSYYGMRGILVVFMTRHLLGAGGELDTMPRDQANSYFHAFVSANYFFSVVGAFLADAWLGKYRTILYLSLVYCAGHLALALDETRLGLFSGLFLIALGAGGIKPCVSAHVGDQFGKSNEHLLEKVFGWFYFAVNFGAFFSTLLTPWLLEKAGPWLAFGVPGVLMFLATVVFWLGRRKFVHVPPAGLGFLRETFSPLGLRVMGKLVVVYVFLSVFWSLYDQSGSSWVLQAERMNLNWMWIEWLPSQVQAINPVLILLYIPLFAYVIYPAMERVIKLTPMRKVTIGFFLTTISYVFVAVPEHAIAVGEKPTIVWQLVAYTILTAGEVMVSITALEFSYTQAPKTMKSVVMAMYMLSVTAGNAFTSLFNALTGPEGVWPLSGPEYFWFFTGLMLAASVGFVFVAANYREERFIQDEA